MSATTDVRRRLIDADPLAQKAAAIRAERDAMASARPLTGDAARVILPILDDLVLGVPEYARDFDWSTHVAP